jgi:hypothetical protein
MGFSIGCRAPCWAPVFRSLSGMESADLRVDAFDFTKKSDKTLNTCVYVYIYICIKCLYIYMYDYIYTVYIKYLYIYIIFDFTKKIRLDSIRLSD